MTDFLWRKVTEKEKEEIRKQAEKIMDDFSEKLSKIDKKVPESLVERDDGERNESEGKKGEAPLGVPQSTECRGNIDREIMFDNAPSKNKDFIVGEKKGW